MCKLLALALFLYYIFLPQVIANQECNVTIPSDLVFLVDESGSVNENNQSNFEKQMQFIANFTSGFKIGPRDVQVGLVTYSTDVKPEYYLNTFRDLPSLQKKTLQVSYNHPGLTFTDAGLDFVRQEMFSPKRGDRPYANNVIIVLTDGASSLPSETVSAAKKVHDANFTVFAIGIGNQTNRKELETIASDPRKNVLVVTDFSSLHGIQGQLQKGTCNVIRNQPTTPGPSTITTTTSTTRKRTTNHQRTSFKSTTKRSIPTTKSKYVSNTNMMTITMTMPITMTTTPMTTSKRTTTTTTTTTTQTRATTTTSSKRKPTTRQQFGFLTNIMTVTMPKTAPKIMLTSTTLKLTSSTKDQTNKGGKNTRVNNAKTENGKSEEIVLPGWFSYLEIGVITAVSVLIISTITCCCHRFCCAAFSRRSDDDDEEEIDIEWKKNFREPIKRPSSVSLIQI